MTERRTAPIAAVGIALALLAPVLAAAAGEASPTATQAPRFEFEVMPYAWIPGVHGSLKVKGVPVHVDVDPSDVLQLVFDGDGLAAAGYFSASWDRFTLFADSFGGYADANVDETVGQRSLLEDSQAPLFAKSMPDLPNPQNPPF